MSASRPFIPKGRITSPLIPRLPEDRKRELRIWWREIDRVLLALILMLVMVGAFAVAAASPSGVRKISGEGVQYPELYYFWVHLRWLALGLAVLFATSILPRELVRRGAILLGAAMLALMVLVPFIGAEVNGARRWINLGMSFQPSEFLKPAYAVMLAWILSWKQRERDMPVIAVSGGLMGLTVILLMAQPNLGAAILFIGTWFVMVMLAGLPLQRIMVMGAAGFGLLGGAYLFYDNARHRIDAFLGGGTAFDQVDLANRTLLGGGWTGTGLGLGQNKMRLPEAHTDYIFSVIGEEFGLLICGLVVLLYFAIVLRVLVRLVEEDRIFPILAGAGLIALFGGQAFINIMVNLQLFPSKGMTLPLISYGGSSTLAQCFTIGMLLAITRRNPCLERERFDLRAALEKDATS